MQARLVLAARRDCVTIITLNRPEKLNALNAAMRAALADTLVKAEHDDATRVVILTGAGRAFCAGVDLNEIGGEPDANPAFVDAITAGPLTAALAALSKPLIGAINGMAVTGGLELALACDVIMASSEARFADTHSRVGVLPGWGLSQRLSRTIGLYRAKEMSLTGNFIDAEQAERWGLVNRVVAPGELMPASLALAADMVSADGRTQRQLKRLIDDGYMQELATGLALEQERAGLHARAAGPQAVAQRRETLQQRGRSQKRAGD